MTEPARLALVTPPIAEVEAFAPALDDACRAAPVAAILLRLEPADERTLIKRLKGLAPVAQAWSAAVIAWVPGEADPALVAVRGGADGVHAPVPEEVRPLRERLGADRMLGVGHLRSKHDAMLAGEAGADYLLFGEPRQDGSTPPLDAVVDRAQWWAEIFETPCIAFAPALADVERLAATGAEFVGLGEAVWAHPEGPGAAVRAAQALLAGGGKP